MTKLNKNTVRLTECAVMLALSTVLGFVKIWQLPMGGSVTLLSMLPVMLISVKYGVKTGVATAFAFSLIQAALGFAAGNVFVWCTTPLTFTVCLLFDYILPFSVLGFAGVFGKNALGKNREMSDTKNRYMLILGFVTVISLRFLCHFITGFTIWGQWADEGTSPIVYSLLYNIQYMLPEMIVTTAAGAVLLKFPQMKVLLNLN